MTDKKGVFLLRKNEDVVVVDKLPTEQHRQS